MRKSILTAMGLGLLLAGSAQAGTAFFDFNTDPTTSGLLTNYGNAVWISSGGAGAATNANDGFLQITAAVGSQRSAIVFADFDAGQVVKAFTFEADIRLGNGTQNPADGFSVNYVRANDPVLTDAAAGGNPAGDGGIWATGPNCEANLPEEGTQTGVSIGFDTWNSDGTAPFCNEADQSIGPDIIGVDVRVDGTLVLQYPTTTQNGSVTDPNSIETGPWDGSNSYTNLGWAHLKVVLDTNATLSVYWKGKELLTNLATSYFPSPGALVFAGRTGGSWANQHVDNIAITTIPAATALVGAASGFVDGFTIQVGDSGTSVFDTNAPLTLKLNGVTVPSSDVTLFKPSGTTTINVHEFPALLPSGSTNTAFISGSDTNGNVISGTRTFTVPIYQALPSSDLVASGVDTTRPGFKLTTWQSSGEPNRVYWADEQLIGLHGANAANLAGFTDGGYMDWASYINFDIATNPGDGNFRATNGYPDVMFPGLPGTVGNGTDSSAIETLCFLQFAAPGVYIMGVNSDDGFEVSEGHNPQDRFALNLGQFDGGRGSSDSLFSVVVTNAGIYPFRMMWFNGGGGANCEWFTISKNVKYLINDPSPTNTSGVTAYFSGPALPAYVSQINPYMGQRGARPDTVLAQLTDGSTTVNGGSIKLLLNGSATPAATTSKSGSVTTVQLPFTVSTLMPPGSSNIAALVWSDSGGAAHSNAWTFTVEPYVGLDASQMASSVDTNSYGLLVAVSQLDPAIVGDSGDSLPNQGDSMNALLAGTYFPWYGTDVVNTAGGNWIFSSLSNNIWNWTNQMDFNVVTSPGDFTFDWPLPGIPGVTGTTTYYASAFRSYVMFPTSGFYQMGVNSDDGFRLSEGLSLNRQVLHVTGTNNVDTDVAAVVSTTLYGNGGFGAFPPLVPITAPVMLVNSNNYTPGGSINLTGKIAVADINLYGANDAMMCYIAQTNGAVGAILINSPANGLPYVMGGTAPGPVTIPALNVNGDFGERDFWLTNGNLTASIGASESLILGAADYGKGMSHVDFGVMVPQPGAYPMRLLYFQGGGGAGMEWTTVNAGISADGGARFLVNDIGNPSSLLTYMSATARPSVVIHRAGTTLQITYSGTLQSSTSPMGPFSDVSGATSPYTVPTTAPQMYFRSH